MDLITVAASSVSSTGAKCCGNMAESSWAQPVCRATVSWPVRQCSCLEAFQEAERLRFACRVNVRQWEMRRSQGRSGSKTSLVSALLWEVGRETHSPTAAIDGEAERAPQREECRVDCVLEHPAQAMGKRLGRASRLPSGRHRTRAELLPMPQQQQGDSWTPPFLSRAFAIFFMSNLEVSWVAGSCHYCQPYQPQLFVH